MDIYSILWVIIQYCFFLLKSLCPALVTGALSVAALGLRPHHCGVLFPF